MKNENMHANRDAFDAYNYAFYDVSEIIDKDMFTGLAEQGAIPADEGWNLAVTQDENLKSLGYTLSTRSLALLAGLYTIMLNRDVDVIDVFGDIRQFTPDGMSTVPMYPDFPSQVISMDEARFRRDQAIHYMSTYGVEFLFSLLGANVEVAKGILPDVENTPKDGAHEHIADYSVLELALFTDDMLAVLADDLTRPKRMSKPAVKLLSEFVMTNPDIELPAAKFHENILNVACEVAKSGSASDIANACSKFCAHAGDVLKLVNQTCEELETNHLSTKQKKGFCRALEAFDAHAIAQNVADASKDGEKAMNRLSIARFGKSNLQDGYTLVQTGGVRSFNSNIERQWTALENDKTDAKRQETIDGLVALYATRPGMMLRSLNRLVEAGIEPQKLVDALMLNVEKLSIATLVTLATTMSAVDEHAEVNFYGARNRQDVANAERAEAKKQSHAKVAVIAAKLLQAALSGIETPMKGKKVYVDQCGFSLMGSVVMPNLVSNTSGAYPPVGMAYDVPADKTVRFFTFWDDRSKRVDVDLHFKYVDSDGRSGSIGWNSHYNRDGMVTSGDITHSTDAAEYLDIDMPVAAAGGVSTVFQNQHIYAGRNNWGDIEKCFSGAIVVGSKEPTAKIYQSDNVIFHDELTGEGRQMEYAMIDVPGHYVRILRGAKLPFEHTAFTANMYVNMLLQAQGCDIVSDADDAEVIVTVGRTNAYDASDAEKVCLIDEKFFIE